MYSLEVMNVKTKMLKGKYKHHRNNTRFTLRKPLSEKITTKISSITIWPTMTKLQSSEPSLVYFFKLNIGGFQTF